MPSYVEYIKVGSGEAWPIRDPNALSRDGGTMAGAIDMGGNTITNLPTPSKDSDAVPKSYQDPRYFLKTGGNITGPVSLGGNRISDVGDPVADTDVVHKSYVDTARNDCMTHTNTLVGQNKSGVIFNGIKTSGSIDISAVTSKYQAFVVTGYTVENNAQTSVVIPTVLLGKGFQLFADGQWVSMTTSTEAISINQKSSSGAITSVIGLI